MNFPEYAGHGAGLTEAQSRGQFIKAAYSHLAVAILAFAVLSFGLYASGASFAMLKMLGVSKWGWLAVMGAFMVVAWLATNAADNSESTGVQYLALGGFVFAVFHGLALYLHDGPWPVGMLIARGVLCLGLLAGTAMLLAPEVTAWRKRLLAQREVEREARIARRQARQQG